MQIILPLNHILIVKKIEKYNANNLLSSNLVTNNNTT